MLPDRVGLSVSQRHDRASSVSYANSPVAKQKARSVDRAFCLAAPRRKAWVRSLRCQPQALRLPLVADAALAAVLVIDWKFASATSTACFDALCTLS